MTSTAVVYQSRYGSTERYAHWIADETDAELMTLSQAEPKVIMRHDTILFGSPILAGTLGCTRFMREHLADLKERRVGLFTVGMSPVSGSLRSRVTDLALHEDIKARVGVFHLRGAIDYGKLSLLHRGMVKLVDRATMRRARRQPTAENLEAAALVGKSVDLVEHSSVEPVTDWARQQ